MARLHLLEIEDQPWCPRVLRDAATAYLRQSMIATGHARLLAPKLGEALRAAGETRLLDLCSGGAGPVPPLLNALREDGLEVGATLTDKYPNQPAFEAMAARSGGCIDYVAESVDATQRLPERRGLLTLFNAFHHFRPAVARRLLEEVARARRPIAVFELVSRHPPALVGILFTPIAVWGIMPFVRPLRLSWLVLTYFVPLLPLLALWDGLVSCLRVYSEGELREMTESIDAPDYRWEIGSISLAPAPVSATYLIGLPGSPSS